MTFRPHLCSEAILSSRDWGGGGGGNTVHFLGENGSPCSAKLTSGFPGRQRPQEGTSTRYESSPSFQEQKQEFQKGDHDLMTKLP